MNNLCMNILTSVNFNCAGAAPDVKKHNIFTTVYQFIFLLNYVHSICILWLPKCSSAPIFSALASTGRGRWQNFSKGRKLNIVGKLLGLEKKISKLFIVSVVMGIDFIMLMSLTTLKHISKRLNTCIFLHRLGFLLFILLCLLSFWIVFSWGSSKSRLRRASFGTPRILIQFVIQISSNI